MTKKTNSSKVANQTSTIVTIALAIIGLLGTLGVAYFNYRASVDQITIPAMLTSTANSSQPETVAIVTAGFSTASNSAPSQSETEQMYQKLSEAKLWNLKLQDSFNNNDAGWVPYNVDNEYSKVSMQIKDGVLRWSFRTKQPEQSFWEIAPISSHSNFYFSAKVKRLSDIPVDNNNASWGLIFRRQGDNIYNFALNDIQEYASWVKNDGMWTNLIGWTRSELIRPNKFNELTIVADGSEIMYFLNGVPIASKNDDTLSSGNVGFTVGLNVVDTEVVFEFDDLEFREKP